MFAKYTNKNNFNKDSSSLSHVKFQHQIARGTKTSDNGEPEQKKAANEKKRALATMLGKINQSAFVDNSDPPITGNISATPSTVNVSSSNSACATLSAAQATAMNANPESTSSTKQPAAKKPWQKKQTRKEIEAVHRANYDDALTQLNKKLGNIIRVHKDNCCFILLVAFVKYHPPSVSAKDAKKELKEKVEDKPTWRQCNEPTRPLLTTKTETT